MPLVGMRWLKWKQMQNVERTGNTPTTNGSSGEHWRDAVCYVKPSQLSGGWGKVDLNARSSHNS